MIKSIIILLCSICYINTALYGQTFITVDKDTYEFIEDVNYSLYSNKKVVYKTVTSNDKPTMINPKIVYDSIVFTKVDYETLGLAKSHNDSVIYLSKKVIYLDELVVNSGKNKEIALGETNRFVKSQYRPITPELMYGVLFVNNVQSDMKLNRVAFYTDNVKFRTAYKINIASAEETEVIGGSRFLKEEDIIYTSETLYLNRKDREESINLPSELHLLPGKKVFVWIQLLGYFDKDGKEVMPQENERTKIKFQMSKLTNFYSRMSDYYTGELTKSLKNINLMINYDFANSFYKTPHKSILVTPAIVLYGQKI